MSAIRIDRIRATRFEIIDHRIASGEPGRRFVIHTERQFTVEVAQQDDGNTVKIFLSDVK